MDARGSEAIFRKVAAWQPHLSSSSVPVSATASAAAAPPLVSAAIAAHYSDGTTHYLPLSRAKDFATLCNTLALVPATAPAPGTRPPCFLPDGAPLAAPLWKAYCVARVAAHPSAQRPLPVFIYAPSPPVSTPTLRGRRRVASASTYELGLADATTSSASAEADMSARRRVQLLALRVLRRRTRVIDAAAEPPPPDTPAGKAIATLLPSLRRAAAEIDADLGFARRAKIADTLAVLPSLHMLAPSPDAHLADRILSETETACNYASQAESLYESAASIVAAIALDTESIQIQLYLAAPSTTPEAIGDCARALDLLAGRVRQLECAHARTLVLWDLIVRHVELAHESHTVTAAAVCDRLRLLPAAAAGALGERLLRDSWDHACGAARATLAAMQRAEMNRRAVFDREVTHAFLQQRLGVDRIPLDSATEGLRMLATITAPVLTACKITEEKTPDSATLAAAAKEGDQDDAKNKNEHEYSSSTSSSAVTQDTGFGKICALPIMSNSEILLRAKLNHDAETLGQLHEEFTKHLVQQFNTRLQGLTSPPVSSPLSSSSSASKSTYYSYQGSPPASTTRVEQNRQENQEQNYLSSQQFPNLKSYSAASSLSVISKKSANKTTKPKLSISADCAVRSEISLNPHQRNDDADKILDDPSRQQK